VKVTAIFKADQEGKRSDIPMAIRAERENVQTGQRDVITFGNFPSPLTRAFDEARERGQKLEADDRKRANRESYEVNRQNQAAREQEQQRLAERHEGKRPDLHLVEDEEGVRRERDAQRKGERELEEARGRAISEQEKLENERRRR
jgi:hypothetical protein